MRETYKIQAKAKGLFTMTIGYIGELCLKYLFPKYQVVIIGKKTPFIGRYFRERKLQLNL